MKFQNLLRAFTQPVVNSFSGNRRRRLQRGPSAAEVLEHRELKSFVDPMLNFGVTAENAPVAELEQIGESGLLIMVDGDYDYVVAEIYVNGELAQVVDGTGPWLVDLESSLEPGNNEIVVIINTPTFGEVFTTISTIEIAGPPQVLGQF